MTRPITLPFYAKLSFILVTLICFAFIFCIGKDILTPILMAFLFAVLLLPIFTFLNTKFKFPRHLAAIVCLIIFISVIVGILVFISYQVTYMANDFHTIKKNANSFILEIHKFIRENFQVSIGDQKKYLDSVTKDSVKNGQAKLGSFIVSISDVLLDSTIMVVYTFLFLIYKEHFKLFFAKLIKQENHAVLQDILSQIKVSINNYIVSLIIEMIVVSVLTSLGLWIIGIKYFVLLGLITGILNLIPYIGITIAGIITVLASLTGSGETSVILGILIVNIIVQFIDNNLLVPLIINSKVEINAFVSIMGIIVGGAAAGIAGMFLAIPLLAILKIIFDRIESLSAWGYLMGNHVPRKFVWRKRKVTTEN
ncbi:MULTISPECIES: AI-2E family transporter [Flavobacterium]|uniref:Pheromone autoinducer 2 transporter n=1 Tax=Flavobacterium anhuiense TaxID=459526 RepID=A0AAC9D560_9FLAO|nr:MULTISPECIES: AI-2E family transporter [Flavobacterium]AOC96762.1 pheromone autoinducer 2 transporter [Flavobacterium anhuiense]URM35889.1 AI-2E family transporter [Flavobacterium anhuiense]SCY40115.1 Predicted PurR-regulated permease PerM [Flavobacterium anhuiense]